MGDAPTLPPLARQGGTGPTGTPAPLPSAADIARLGAKQHRKAARRQRRRSQFAGRLLVLILLAALAGAAYLGYREFVEQPDPVAQLGGLQSVLGDAIGSVSGLDTSPYDFPPEWAGTVALGELTGDELLPTFALGVADDLGPAHGLQRYAIDIDDLGDLQPTLTSRWLGTLARLPQSPVDDAVLPAPGPGELTIGIARSGDRVARLVVRAEYPPLSIDITG